VKVELTNLIIVFLWLVSFGCRGDSWPPWLAVNAIVSDSRTRVLGQHDREEKMLRQTDTVALRKPIKTDKLIELR